MVLCCSPYPTQQLIIFILRIMIGSVILGLVAGYIANVIQKGKGQGCLINLVLGIVGGVVGNILFGIVGFSSNSVIGELICSVVGALVILWLVAKLK